MYAIVRQGNGKYYTSTVFGYFHDVKSTDDYQRYLERIHSHCDYMSPDEFERVYEKTRREAELMVS